jgi:pantoate--beta-alanine ligase
LEKIKEKAVSRLIQAGFRPDYAEIADAKTLNIVQEWDGKQPLVALIAAFLNDIRLIDNLQLTGEIS